MLFAEAEHIPIHQVESVEAIWLFRWRAKTKAEGARRAIESQEAYRDKDGNENWAEWAKNNPHLKKLVTWADTD